MATDQVTVRVLEVEKVDPAELADFLHLFRVCHSGLRQLGAGSSEISDDELPTYRRRLAELSPESLNALFESGPDSDDLSIERISHQSPLEVVLVGSVVLLVLRVALLGGKIEISAPGQIKVKAEIPTLGKALAGLRKALGLSKHLSAAFAVHGTVVKLDKDELAVLTQEVKGEGGFQDFFRRLQLRVGKNCSIRLDDEDLERIYKYKDHPEDGGFQTRISKIFGKHFPESRPQLLLKPASAI